MSKQQPYDIAQLGQLLGVEIGKTFRLTRRGQLRKQDATRCILALARRYAVDLRSVAP
ncbi:hypothetical protein [Burkholderia multivorans]|uniref:hypothetical protein n=1 Tax=Burkholderia multivorans TaxID=87883 RepID=UPI0021C08D03|nr:hypothetical protein [Burkholderia multivorans]MDR8763807.1 hypothetical protein [Burkholderia multivorans]MDR8775201.1 hypothetical protein [Burkholderia multivorans]MDR8793536.1 hypothetical protein [Burkholderia multivorans]MDR8799227.1 hypothetical protein [Burkholderia multivorans]MDR8804915.1 hypothetical protein [Burkholderia multivorans]